MKNITILLCCFLVVNHINAQVDSLKTDSVKHDVKSDTTRIILGNKEIKIVDSEEGTDINVRDKDETISEDNDSQKKGKDRFSFKPGKEKKNSNKFNGHWNAIEFGFNGYLNKDKSMSLTGNDQFMSLNTNPSKSMNININFGQVDVGLIGKSVGLVTGLGFNFNNYFFENNNSIIKGINGRIQDTVYTQDLNKSKLAIMYFTIPLLLEVQLPKLGDSNKRIWFAGGILGSVKLSSHTKVVYHENGDRKKDKERDDFNISALTYGFTARAGYSKFYAYGNYFPVQLFETGKGPELYPFAVGVGLHF